jgi:hypothetical protein
VEKKDLEKLTREYVQANDAYEKLMGKFVASGPAVGGKAGTMPERMLTPIGLGELDEAWGKVEAAQEAWHQRVLEYSGRSSE